MKWGQFMTNEGKLRDVIGYQDKNSKVPGTKIMKTHEYYRKQFDTDKKYCIRELWIHGLTIIRGDLISNLEPELLPSSPQPSPTTEDDDNDNDNDNDDDNEKTTREKAQKITTQLKRLTPKFQVKKLLFKQEI